MPSPFPGMNPYLEQDDVRHDFHERFMPAAAEMLGAQLMPGSIVKIDEHVYVHDLARGTRRLAGRADLAVGPIGMGPAPGGAGAVAAPVEVELPGADVERPAFIEVRDRRSRELIPVVELLGPSNKRGGPDRAQFLARRGRNLNSPAHLVEIDLLRGGEPMPAEERPPRADSVVVRRAEARPRAGFWPIRLREPLPDVPVPVRASDPDARLDLQAILHRIYDAAGYHHYVYEASPDPPLSFDDAGWARSLVPVPT